MSKKQLGAASGGGAINRDSQSWLRRLRAQPGFRTALIAFCLTVVLGIGGSAAYAYWSLRADANLTMATAPPELPIPADAKCELGRGSEPNRVEWPHVKGAHPEARYIVSFEAVDLKKTVYFSVPMNYSSLGLKNEPYNRSIQPYYLSDLRSTFGATGGSWERLRVSVQTGLLTSATSATAPEKIRKDQILRTSEGSSQFDMYYWTFLVAAFPCQ